MKTGIATRYAVKRPHLLFAIDRTRPIVTTALITVGHFPIGHEARLDPVTLTAASSYMQGVEDTLRALERRGVDLSILEPEDTQR